MRDMITLSDRGRILEMRRERGERRDMITFFDGGEESQELETDEGSLGNDGAVLLLDGEEVLVGGAVGEDDSLAAEGAYLGAANVEDVAVAGEERQGDIALGRHEAVAETGTVDVEGQVVAATDVVETGELLGAVEGAELCGEGDVDQSGMDGMVAVAVVIEVVKIVVEDGSGELTCLL